MTRSFSSHTAHKNHKAHSGSTDRLVPTLADTETSADLIPPKQRKREHWLHVIFYITLIGKGLFGLGQMASGIVVLVVPRHVWHQLAVKLTAGNTDNPVTAWLLHQTENLDSGIQLYAAIYMISHAATKIVLVWAVLKGKMWAYPWMMGFLAAFIIYQTYEIFARHSIFFLLLTIFDIFIVWLTRHEWNLQKRQRALKQAAAAAASGPASAGRPGTPAD